MSHFVLVPACTLRILHKVADSLSLVSDSSNVGDVAHILRLRVLIENVNSV